MKTIFKLLVAFILIFCLPIACSESNGGDNEDIEIPCGTYNGNQLFKGPRGGCYYKNSNNNKTYVDRSYCSCL